MCWVGVRELLTGRLNHYPLCYVELVTTLDRIPELLHQAYVLFCLVFSVYTAILPTFVSKGQKINKQK